MSKRHSSSHKPSPLSREQLQILQEDTRTRQGAPGSSHVGYVDSVAIRTVARSEKHSPYPSPKTTRDNTPYVTENEDSDEEMGDTVPLFDGKARDVSVFVTKVRGYLAGKSKLSDAAAAAYIASKFSGTAWTWYETRGKERPSIRGDPGKLLSDLEAKFTWSDDAKKTRAAGLIGRCKQGNRSVTSYEVDFNSLSTELGWNDEQKRVGFQQGLSYRIRSTFVGSETVYATYAELVRRAEELDECYLADKLAQVSIGQTSAYAGRKGGRGGGKAKCFKCGKYGHKKANCQSA